ncbi:MAG: hypothetical protein NUV88_00480, partial [Candidatus Kaiserbacteria bacterium]|nr:hypothetical protein [Candidatus Kaiserbacteria bacterium]
MRRFLLSVVTVAVLGVLFYTYRAPIEERLRVVTANLQAMYMPCKKPIMYSLGDFDARFGISKKDFLSAVGDAEAIWEKPIGRNLFEYSADGRLAVNLVYDYRQEATHKLQKIGLAVDESRASYDALQAKYTEMKSLMSQAQAQYEASVTAYNKRLDAYNKEVQYWNHKGGAPK